MKTSLYTPLKFGLSCLALAAMAISHGQVRTDVAALIEYSEMSRNQSRLLKVAAEQRARLLGIPIREVHADGSTIELMRFEGDFPVYYATDNVNAAISTATNRIHPGGGFGYTLTGQNMILGIWDSGRARPTHQEFGGRVIVKDGSSNSDHGTHVAGTMMAAGTVAAARGMAYQATLHSYDWNSDNSEMASEAAAGLLISNHSYGQIAGWRQESGQWYWYGDPSLSQTQDWKFGFYNQKARDWDQIAFNAPYYLIVKSAGNNRNGGPNNQPTGFYWNGSSWVANTVHRDRNGAPLGYDCLPTYSTAKNILTVAAVEDVIGGYSGPNSVVMSSFSSWGPTDDGRIKPDISGNGVGLYSSTAGSNSSYASFSGTSMSAPNVSGSLILLQQLYRSLYAGQSMRAATLKGLVIHTADECGPNPGPDYMFGWGLLNSLRASQTITASTTDDSVINERVLNQGATYSIQVYNDGAKPLRATLSWTDPAGTVGAPANNNPAKKLVNDLDLRIIRNDGLVLYPYILNPANPQAAASFGDDSINNVEQVHIQNPSPGTYTIRVTHKGNLQGGSQAFSLVVTGQDPSPAIGNGFAYQNPNNGMIGIAATDGTNFGAWRTFPQVVGSQWEVLGFGDFAGLPMSDAFIRNKSTGQVAVWETNGQNFVKFNLFPQVPNQLWDIIGIADFDNDGVDDIAFRNKFTGQIAVWSTNGHQFTNWRVFPQVPNSLWSIEGVGDFNNDGIADFLFKNSSTGQIAVWRTDGTKFTSWHVFPQVPHFAWRILGSWDMDGDGIADVVFQHLGTLQYAVWRTDGTKFTSWHPFPAAPPVGWNFKGYGSFD